MAWTDVSDEPVMPDLYALFEGGGTLNLRVNIPGTTDRLGSLTGDPPTADDDHGRNQRQVVINEVMWAHDESFLGNAVKLVNSGLNFTIEAPHRSSFLILKFTTSKEFPSPLLKPIAE